MAFIARVTRPAASANTLGAVGFVAAILIVVAGNYNVAKGENGGTVPALVSAIICLALAAGLFGYAVPRAANPDRAALVVGVIAIISVAAFWSGVTPVLAAASVALGGRSAAEPTRATVIVQGLALVAALLALIVTLAQSHLF